MPYAIAEIGRDSARNRDSTCCYGSAKWSFELLHPTGYKPYISAIPLTWSGNCDYAQIIKRFGNTPEDQRRYSPARIIGIDRNAICGQPDEKHITTSHVERHNLTNRMHNRRFTRLTNAFSKKWENHNAMFALYIAWYNYCRPHMTLKTTPAVAAGLAKEPWALERLLKESASCLA
ncbi:MAG: hypothetical protein O7G86_15715 [Gammaproteobacteria bacterium]|nr:hypothetical protein [Gammaproteobacteria bacterium]